MASFLSQFQTIKNACDRIVIAVEDVSDLWPLVKDGFENRLPFKKACLNNKTHNPIYVEKLPAEFILTTDSRLRSRYPQERSLFWFREPYATIVLFTCEDLDEFKNILKPRLKLIVQNDEREWFIIFVSKASPSNDQATKLAKKIYARLEVDFNSKKKERCCKLDLHGADSKFWEDLELKMIEFIRNELDKRIQFYEEEIRKLTEQRFLPIWNFCNFFILKESLAFMFEMAHLHEDALREYDELELCYLETVNTSSSKSRDFGGLDTGDDQAALLMPGNKNLTEIVHDDSFRQFEFRQYLFACQSKLLFKLNRPVEVASRGYLFIINFSTSLALHESLLPFCMREVWVITACLALISSTTSLYDSAFITPDVAKEFFRLQGDLYSLCRIKFMRLGYLIGYGAGIERSPGNSAILSMLPWPKPAVWPSVPPEASSAVLAKEKIILQANSPVVNFNIRRKPLPLEPSSLLREANRRRASLSSALSEYFDGLHNRSDGLGLDGNLSSSPSRKVHSSTMTRTNSIPMNFESTSLDPPMRLSEIYVAAEDAIRHTVSDPNLWRSLSSIEEFEKKYLELTKGAAENYHHSWWKRHGVVLDGELAAVSYKHGNFDQAAKSYEKVCALYAGEGWQHLLADVLPYLAECQKILGDQAGYLSSCVRMLSLDKNLFSTKERQAFQSEVILLAHSKMQHPVPLDVSSLISFSGIPGPPLELCDGDPGMLSVTVWSGFPDEIALESLSLTLIATFSADEGVKDIKCSNAPILKPGKNSIILTVPPQKPGSYVLGVLTGQIGHLSFRSHSFSKGGSSDSDDFIVYEKPTRPVLKVHMPRSLVDLTTSNSSALLLNESQWVGLVLRPINYSLKGAVLCIDPGSELMLQESHVVEIESYTNLMQSKNEQKNEKHISVYEQSTKIMLENKRLKLPDWASDITSVIWLPIRAVDNSRQAKVASPALPQSQSIVHGLRMVGLELEFGVAQNQTFKRTIAVHFTDPFDMSFRVTEKCTDGSILLQVTLVSQVKATLTIRDAWLELQPGFVHIGNNNGRPSSDFFPLTISPSSRAGLLFPIRLGNMTPGDEGEVMRSESILNLEYEISGDRTIGAHMPFITDSGELEMPNDQSLLHFKSALVLQRPVLDRSLAVGFLPLSSDDLRVGQHITMKWRIEKLKSDSRECNINEVLYEIEENPENWMVAGRKRGHITLSKEQGSIIIISILCLPLVAGYVRPPQLKLPDISESDISCDPPGPHLVCVLPPILSSSFCIPTC